MNVVELKQVSKTYKRRRGDVAALKDISLLVERGEAFGFVGPNGAGKSTTIKIILNIVSDYQGEVRIFDRSSRDAIARRYVGYVPESPALYEQLTPLEILKAGLSLHGVVRTKEMDWCVHWLERFSIGHVARRKLRELSKGTVQRVALAHAMAIQPRLLILDEPLSGLDPVGRRDVIDILAEYKKEGGTIFLTSHVLHDVERLADRFGLIHKGQLVTISSPNDIVGGEQMFTIRSIGEASVEGGRSEAGKRWFCEVSGDEVWSQLKRLEQANHQLLEVRPTLTLESAFFRYLQNEDNTSVFSPSDR